MKRYNGNEKVKPGFYLSTKRWDLETIDKTEGLLPGIEEETYLRIPLPLMLVAGPAVGFLFVVFLPLIGFLMLLYMLGGKAHGGLTVAKAMVVRGLHRTEVKVQTENRLNVIGTGQANDNLIGQASELSGQNVQDAETLRKAS